MRKLSLISQMLNGRIGKQCKERWHNHLRPNIKVSFVFLLPFDFDFLFLCSHSLLMNFIIYIYIYISLEIYGFFFLPLNQKPCVHIPNALILMSSTISCLLAIQYFKFRSLIRKKLCLPFPTIRVMHTSSYIKHIYMNKTLIPPKWYIKY